MHTALENCELDTLDVHNNNITSIPELNSTRLWKISFHGNPFECDCRMVWLRKARPLFGRRLDYGDGRVFCMRPRHLLGVSFDLLRPVDLSCLRPTVVSKETGRNVTPATNVTMKVGLLLELCTSAGANFFLLGGGGGNIPLGRGVRRIFGGGGGGAGGGGVCRDLPKKLTIQTRAQLS